MKTGSINEIYTFACTPHIFYEILMDSDKHSKLTQSNASISKQIGEEFSVFNGSIIGKNIELVEDKKIVQLWRDDDWVKGHYSKLSFELNAKGNNTIVHLTQIDIPINEVDKIKAGWEDYYWIELRKMLKIIEQ